MDDWRRSSRMSMDPLMGRTVLGRYEVVQRLAAGGMGVVYLARYRGAHGFVRPVVVKIIVPRYAADDHFLGLFIREAKILSALRDPGIVDVIDFGQQNDFYVMVLEYVHGYELLDWFRYREHKGRTFSVDVSMQIIISVLDALYHAHFNRTPEGESRTIIHRDISPSNVMITNRGIVKIVDFGIAQMANMTGGYKTKTGTFKGKLSYAAPERLGSASLKPQCDIYSAGVMLHELLVGTNEFYTGDHASTIARVLNHHLTPVRLHRPDAPRELDDVIQKAVAKNPDDRFDSALNFANALRKLLGQREDVVKVELARLVEEEFTNEMADFLGCEPLSVRDRSWRHPSESPLSVYPSLEDSAKFSIRPANIGEPTEKMAVMDGTPDVLVETTNGERSPEDDSRAIEIRVGRYSNYARDPSRKGPVPNVILHIRPAVIISLIVVLSLIIGIIVVYWALFRDIRPDENDIVVIQESRNVPGRESEKPMMLSDVDGTSDEPAFPRVDLNAPDLVPPEPEMLDQNLSIEAQALILTTLFQKKQSDVEECLRRNERLLAGANQMLIRFTIGTDGTVLRTSLIPSKLKKTPIQKCIARIARDTQFPKLKKQLSFAIPVVISH